MAGSNVILNRLCGLENSNFEVTDCKVKENEIIWQIEHKGEAFYVCSRCEEKLTSRHSLDWIKLLDVPFGKKRCKWLVKRARILCTCTNHVRVEKMPFRSSHHFLTQRFVDHIEQVLCSKMFTVADVARLFEIDYGTVYKIDHEVLLRLFQTLPIPDPIHIAVDEKSFLKGHSYVTIVTDTDLAKVIWVSKGNSKESLDIFFRTLGKERCLKIKTVAKDMLVAYSSSCKEFIPHAIEIADKFHVVQALNRAIDDCRIELAVKSKLGEKRREKIHKLHWLLRFKQENLPEKYLESLEKLEELNQPLYQAYLHKESFFEFFEFKPNEIKEAENFLIRWIVEAYKINLWAFREFAGFIERQTDKLLNIVREQRTSAISEGINRKISVIKSMAYGYKNIQYFMLKILQRCGVLGAYYRPATPINAYSAS